MVEGVYDDAFQKALQLKEEKGYTFIHPFDDVDVIAGQGTIGLELINQLKDIDAVIVPIGGGGLISGVAYAIKSLNPGIKIYGVQSSGAPSMFNSVKNGAIGKPIGGAAYMMCSGHESWHPSPEFYYDIGGGPLFDMGPYYITALVRLLGPVKSVYAVGTKAFAERTITSTPKFGQKIPVKVDTHNVGILSFENGAVVSAVELIEAGLIKKTLCGVKVLGGEKLTKKLTVKVNAFTKTAKEKIENIGGKTEVI